MDFISKVKELVTSTKEYAELRFKELKLAAIEKISSTFADVTAGIILSVFVIIFIFFTNIWAALFLNEILASEHFGFLIVGCFWLFIGLIIYIARRSLIKKPVRNWMIQKVMNTEKNDD